MIKQNTLIIISLFFLIACTPTTQEKVAYTPTGDLQLSRPHLLMDAICFEQSTSIKLELAHPDVEIRYTLDGSKVTEKSPLYSEPITAKKSGIITAQAFHPDFKPSPPIWQEFIKFTKLKHQAKVKFSSKPHKNYPGNGAMSMIDLEKGTTNFRKGTFWSGFQTDELTIDFKFSETEVFNSVMLSCLESNGHWIFLPASVEVFSNGKKIGSQSLETPKKAKSGKVKFITIPLAKVPKNNLQLKIKMDKIPDWHDGKGTTPWLFIDEVLFN